MFKPFPAFLLFQFVVTTLFAQDETTRLSLFPPKGPRVPVITNSLYNDIEVIDSRQDTVIGKVQVGLLKNRDASLLLPSPLQPVFTRLMDSLTHGSGRDGRLIFQLRDFNFAEENYTRYIYLSATLYVKNGATCQKLADLDTVIVLIAETAVNINKVLAPEAGKIITGFIANFLVKTPDDPMAYSPGDILHIDTIEKRRIPVYWRNDYVDGIYNTYASFKQQLPDRQAMVKTKKDGSIASVGLLDEQAKAVKLKPGDIFALVYRGKPYIATDYGFYPLLKVNNDLFFTGDLPVAHPPKVYGLQAGPIVIPLGSRQSATPATYDAIIDYRNGNPIRLKQIPPPAQIP